MFPGGISGLQPRTSYAVARTIGSGEMAPRSRLHDPSITSTIMPRSLAMPDAGTTLTFSSIGRSSPAIAAATLATPRRGIRTRLIFAHVGARVEIAGCCFVQSSSITGYLIGDHIFIICE